MTQAGEGFAEEAADGTVGVRFAGLGEGVEDVIDERGELGGREVRQFATDGAPASEGRTEFFAAGGALSFGLRAVVAAEGLVVSGEAAAFAAVGEGVGAFGGHGNSLRDKCYGIRSTGYGVGKRKGVRPLDEPLRPVCPNEKSRP